MGEEWVDDDGVDMEWESKSGDVEEDGEIMLNAWS